MRQVICEACGASNEVDPRRIPANGMKMRCPSCGASVHVMPQEGSSATKPTSPASPRPSVSELELDLPAPKPKAGPTASAGLPAPKPASKLPELELDLPAVKPKDDKPERKPFAPLPSLSSLRAPLASSAADDLTDLPAPKPREPGTGPKPAARKPLATPFHEPDAAAGAPASKKTAPASLQAVRRSEPKLDDLDAELDLALQGAVPLPVDDAHLPGPVDAPSAPKPGFKPAAAHTQPTTKNPAIALDFALDLPAPKLRTPAPQPKPEPGSHGASGLELDLPMAAVPTPKKSFAKPSAEQKPAPVAQPPSSAGTLPKDSLAIDSSAFFANTAPLGMFGKLDELEGSNATEPLPTDPSNDIIDLPAPQDLPALKRPAPKSTAFGLGGKLPKDSLDIAPGFEGPAPMLPVISGLPESGPSPFAERRPAMSDLDVPALKSPLEGVSELDLPAPRDLPALKKPALGSEPSASLRGAPALSELDLPAPRDLPVVKKPAPQPTALGLGRPPERSHFDAPSFAGEPQLHGSNALELPPLGGARSAAPEIDLGEFERALDGLESKGGGSFALGDELALPEPRKRMDAGSFAELDPIALPSAGASNNQQLPISTLELAPHDLFLGNDQGFAAGKSSLPDLGMPGGGGAGPSLPALGAPGSAGGDAFGELDLGVGRETGIGLPLNVPLRQPTAAAAPAARAPIEDAQILGEEGAVEPARQKRKLPGRNLPGWVLPVGLVAALGAGGTALGMFTDYGWFGVYLIERVLPASGDPAQVRAAIEQAERQAKSDNYVDARRALVTLSDARNEAGLNRELLARSLLHESLYQLRFGEDAQSAQRAAAILARVLERGADVEGLSLARAADAARRGDLAEARRLLAEAPAEGDRFRGLVAGELALLEKQWDAAAQSFAESAAQGEVARGQWGVARARIAQDRLADAEKAAEATLKASPLHVSAHTLLAEQALKQNLLEDALQHARIATGQAQVNGVAARPSRPERARAHSVEGRIEERRDHTREAAQAYEQALSADPLGVQELIGSGRMAMRLGRPQDALSRFDSALNAKPSAQSPAGGTPPAIEAGVGAVEALLALQRAEEALPRVDKLLAQAPEDAQVRLWRGRVLEALERFEEAEAEYRDAMSKAPKQFDGYVALSQLLFKRNRPEEAARVLSLASGQVKDSAEVRRMLGHSELTRAHLPEAIQQFEAALKFDMLDAGALFGLATAQRKSGRLDAAEATLARLQKTAPTFPGLGMERGLLLEQRGRVDAAIDVYRKALAQRPNDTDLKLRLGAALVTAGQLDEAEAMLRQVLKERPTAAEAEHYLGRVLFARKETALAVQRFERAVNFNPLEPTYHLHLAWALLDQGDFGGALESVQRAIQRDPNLGDARWILGRIQLRTGAVKDALVNFQAALRLNPSRTEVLANMGDAYDELRDLSNATKSYQEALKKAPDNPEWWYRLGQLQLDKGQRDAARQALSEAVTRGDRMRERPSWLAEAHRAYGDVLRESKRGADAAEHYKLFLELAPLGHPDRNEIEQLVYQLRH